MMKNIYAIILAAGKGTRMNATDVPKVMFSVAGKPMIRYILSAVKQITNQIYVIVGFQGQKVIDELKSEKVTCVWQRRQLGTAHAVLQVQKYLQNKSGAVLIVNGDHPLFRVLTFNNLIKQKHKSGEKLVFASAIEDNHKMYGRVLRDKDNNVTDIIEAKDATPEQLEIREKNPGVYLVDNAWLWSAIKRIKKSKVSGEYYVTDLVKLALKDKVGVGAYPMDNPNEIKGINTPEELREVEKIIRKKKEFFNRTMSIVLKSYFAIIKL